MPVLGVIPARLGSRRLPRKPLQPLGGVPLIVRVAERAAGNGVADQLVVATDSPEIEAVVRQAGFTAVLTSESHPTGTDRVHEVAARPEFARFDEILNLQGDGPFLPFSALSGAVRQLRLGFDLGTAATPLDPGDRGNPARVKVVMDPSGRALGFSRVLIPGLVNWHHLGLYAYRRQALEKLARAEPVAAERVEGLEQLRALALGLSIGVARLDEPAGPEVDTEADLQQAQSHWTLTHEVTR